MLVFIDESGDPGMDLGGGASEFFVVTAVAFQEEKHAIACCKRIDELRKQAGIKEHVELHFAKSSNRVRLSVLQGIASCDFFYRSVVINKKAIAPSAVRGGKHAFHLYAAGLVLETWRPHLLGAEIDIDKAGGESFTRAVTRYISRNFKDRTG